MARGPVSGSHRSCRRWPRRWLPRERCEATIPKLRQVALRRPGRALELPFDIAAPRFNARAELFEYPPPAMIDPGVTSRVPGDNSAVRARFMVAR